jgi:hypothetical protein
MPKTIVARFVALAIAAISAGSVLADVRLTNDFPVS